MLEKNASLEKITYKLITGETETAVGWVTQSDVFLAVHQVSTGEKLIGTPEWISMENVIAREKLYTEKDAQETFKSPFGSWELSRNARWTNEDFKREYMGEWKNTVETDEDAPRETIVSKEKMIKSLSRKLSDG